jgi:outer membrane protein assembly factor BamB
MSESILVVAFSGHVFGVDPSSGEIAWSHDVGSETPRLIVTDTRVFAAGNGMCCLAYPSGELIWQTKSYVSRTATFMKSGDRLFAAINGEVECYSAVDGKSLWTNKFRGKGSDVVALGTPSSVTQADRF